MSSNSQRQTFVCEREGGAHAAGGVRGQGREVGPRATRVITTHGFRRGGRRCCGMTADIINNNMLISCFSPTISRRLGVFFTKRNMRSQPKTNSLIIPCAEKKHTFTEGTQLA